MAMKPKKKVSKPRLAAVNGSLTDAAPPWDDDEIPGVKSYDVSADAEARPPAKRRRALSEPVYEYPAEVEEEMDAEETRFFATMNQLAARVADLDKPYNGTAVREETVRAMLSANLRMLPVAKQIYMKSKRDKDSYAFTNLAQMNQSLLAEMNTMVTTDEQAARLISEVLAPAFEAVVAYVGAELGEIQRNMATARDVPALQRTVRQKLGEFSRAFATYTQEAANRAEGEIVRVLK